MGCAAGDGPRMYLMFVRHDLQATRKFCPAPWICEFINMRTKIRINSIRYMPPPESVWEHVLVVIYMIICVLKNLVENIENVGIKQIFRAGCSKKVR